MKIENVVPCICTKHPPTVADRSTYGMPILLVSHGAKRFSFKCPACGRGGFTEYTSAYLALKGWNKMQTSLYSSNEREIVFEDDFEKYTNKETGEYLPEYKSKWDEL